MAVANDVARRRAQAGLSQAALAEKAGIPRYRVSMMETGKVLPESAEVDRLAAVLGVLGSQLWPSKVLEAMGI